MVGKPDDLFALVDCVPTPIFILDVTEGDIPVYAHYNTCALDRLDRALSDIVGKTSVEAFGEQYGAAAYQEQRKTIMARVQRNYEFQLPFGDEVRIIRTTLVPQFDDHGKVTRLIGSSIDVSVEWIAETTQAKLNTIGSEVEQFVAIAAHDLRSPMRNVRFLAEMLEDGFEDLGNGKIEMIRLLKETSDTSMQLISDILSYACSLNPADAPCLYRLDKLCEKIMLSLDPQSTHSLTVNALTLSGEKNVMQIVLRNLIDNAIKHGKRAQMSLTCSARVTENEMVEIELSDDGEGFANPGTVFLDTGTFRSSSGYGLLAIRRMITTRGGDISAFNSPVTGGSIVRFTLPNKVITANSGKIMPTEDHKTADQHPTYLLNAAGLRF